MKRRTLTLLALLFLAGLAAGCKMTPRTDTYQPSGGSGPYSLRIDKTRYRPGERIRVAYTADPSWPGDAWVGIIPAHVPHGDETVNDQYDITYQYLRKTSSGILYFMAPGPGRYDLRLHDTDVKGREIAFVSFTVEGEAIPVDTQGGSLSIENPRKSYRPGEPINVRFRGSASWPGDAWVGIIPAHVPHGSELVNDQHDITYQYLNGRTQGVMTFYAPSAPGRYDFRLHHTDRGGVEVASVGFLVETGGRDSPAEAVVPMGKQVGVVGRKSPRGREILVKSGKASDKIRMGDRLYLIVEGKPVLMTVTYPMMTVVKCRLEARYRGLFSKIKQGMPVYRYVKGIEKGLQPPAPPSEARVYIGVYHCQGVNPGGQHYTGTVTLSKDGNLYRLFWQIGSTTYRGSGTLKDNLLTIDWGSTYPVIYRVESDGRLVGTWANGQGTETLTPRR